MMSTCENTTHRLKCPACGYPLLNLPAWHACPECGVAYDPHSKYHKLSSTGPYVGQIAWLLTIALLGTPILMPSSPPDGPGVLLEFYAVLLVLCLWPVLRIIRSTGGVCRVRIDHRGIHFEHPDTAPLHVGWQAFDSAAFNFITGRLKIRNAEGHQLLRRRDRSIGTPGFRKKLAAELIELARVYQSGVGRPTASAGEGEPPERAMVGNAAWPPTGLAPPSDMSDLHGP